ncbi:MAG TPA: HigA family addiction module antitoxin [Terracidiphilus sp.]|nr:HigA family addiction module antitoxin [Terracidiphilus sp.]
MEMFNPPHPGEVLQDSLEGLNMNVTRFAKHIGVSRVTLSRVLNCRGAITPEMSLRLSAALGTSPGLWFRMQGAYDLWQAKRKKLPKIKPLPKAA